MHRVHGLLPGAAGEPPVSRPQAGRPGRRTPAPQGSLFLQLCAEVLHELQALRGGLPVGRQGGRPDPGRPHQIRQIRAAAARPHPGFDRPDGYGGAPGLPGGERGHRPRRHAERAGRDHEDRPPARVPEIQRPQFRGLAEAPGEGTGRVPGAGGLLPRLLRELQQSRAGQGPRQGAERAGRGRAAAGQGEMLRHRHDHQRHVRPGDAQCGAQHRVPAQGGLRPGAEGGDHLFELHPDPAGRVP